jgi:hypothetical protein
LKYDTTPSPKHKRKPLNDFTERFSEA